MNVLSLFSGIGGLDLGLERAGMTTVGQVELDPFCQRVLAKHWPEVPRHDDVRTAPAWWASEPRPAVDAVAGGFPCQPASLAGRRLAQQDERWLWPAFAEVVKAVQPDWVIGENVAGLRTRGLATVEADLRALGYAVRTGVVRACEMGAPHPRPRLFILAHLDGPGLNPRGWLGPSGSPAIGTGWWASEPRVGRVAHGLPGRVDRCRALGNAVVPQVGEHIGRLITAPAEEGSAMTITPSSGHTLYPQHILQFFAYGHLASSSQAVSKPFAELAQHLADTLPGNPETTAALRKLLEAKDCAVRAAIAV